MDVRRPFRSWGHNIRALNRREQSHEEKFGLPIFCHHRDCERRARWRVSSCWRRLGGVLCRRGRYVCDEHAQVFAAKYMWGASRQKRKQTG